MRQACRIDANHNEIKKVFLYFGFDVIDTSSFSGKMLDLFVSLGSHFFQFIEIKDGNKPKSKRKLTPDEIAFIEKHKENCTIIETKDQAIRYCSYVIAGEKF